MSFVTNKLNGFTLGYNGTPATGNTLIWDGSQYVSGAPYLAGQPVSTASVPEDSLLIFNGSQWVPSAIPTATSLQTYPVNAATPAAHDLLTWDGENNRWTPLPPSPVVIDTFINRPTVGHPGRIFASTDGKIWVDDGILWRPWLNGTITGRQQHSPQYFQLVYQIELLLTHYLIIQVVIAWAL